MQVELPRNTISVRNEKELSGRSVAVATEKYLMGCLVYIDLNMVRAGVVVHPRDWCFEGYNEIFNPSERYGIIDRQNLLEKCG